MDNPFIWLAGLNFITNELPAMWVELPGSLRAENNQQVFKMNIF